MVNTVVLFCIFTYLFFIHWHCILLFNDCYIIIIFMLFHRRYFDFVGFAAVPPANNNFVTDYSFSSVFGNQDSQSGEYFDHSYWFIK